MITPLPSSKVLVTGAHGFIGMHTVLRLLQLGYNVRATVRKEAHEHSVREILSGHVDTSQLEFACVDLWKDDGWQEAVHGCDYVIHTAAPYVIENPKDENELIIPIRDGTLRVLHASQAEGIKRLVMVSSFGTVFDGHMRENRNFDASDWANIEKCFLVYHKAKTLAERAAWDFIQGVDNMPKMEMVSIIPTTAVGPVLDNHIHPSTEWFRVLLRAEVPGVPRILLPLVDVRELVDILAKSMTVPGAAGKRFICNAVLLPVPEFAQILSNNYSSRGYRIPTRIVPDWVFQVLGQFSPKIKAVTQLLKWNYTVSTEETRSVFDWQPRPYQQSIIDMAESMIQIGMV